VFNRQPSFDFKLSRDVNKGKAKAMVHVCFFPRVAKNKDFPPGGLHAKKKYLTAMAL